MFFNKHPSLQPDGNSSRSPGSAIRDKLFLLNEENGRADGCSSCFFRSRKNRASYKRRFVWQNGRKINNLKCCAVGRASGTSSETSTREGDASCGLISISRSSSLEGRPDITPAPSARSNQSFFSCAETSHFVDCGDSSSFNVLTSALVLPACVDCHEINFNPEAPIRTAFGVTPGSFEESMMIASALCGHWVTILERSESLDAQFRFMGLNVFKRAVMNRLAVPLTLFLENNKSILKCCLHTPVGTRTMMCDLRGIPSFDEDADVGRWEGVAKVVDYSIPWFCNGIPVRAIQQIKQNKKVGTVIDTRCVLPDVREGKIFYYNITMHPKADPTRVLSSDRLLRYDGPGRLD